MAVWNHAILTLTMICYIRHFPSHSSTTSGFRANFRRDKPHFRRIEELALVGVKQFTCYCMGQFIFRY